MHSRLPTPSAPCDTRAAIPDAPDLATVFAALPGTAALLLRADPPAFTIVDATDEYLEKTFTGRSIVGQPLFRALTDDPSNADASGVSNLRSSLETVIATRATHRMDVQRYDVQRADGSWDLRYWAPQNAPVPGPGGEVRFIIHHVRDVTLEVLGREALGRSERRAARTLERMADAHAILDRDFRFVSVNPAAERAMGKTLPELAGRSHWEVFPASFELVGDAYQRVVREGVEQHFTVHYVGEGYDVHLEIDAYPTDEGGVAVFWRDVTDRIRATEALRDESTRKDEFLATLAHELRNPLAPIRNGLQILRLSPGAPAAARAVAVMERQLAHMVHLIDDLMDVSRIRQGMIRLRLQDVDVRELAAGVVEAWRPQLDAAGLQLEMRMQDELLCEPLRVRADPTRLVQVIGNLLGNAVKFTPSPGSIQLEVRREGGHVVVRVTDSGIGIARAELARIFDLFTQLPGPDTLVGKGGLGIGLSIAQRLVQLHGGSIHADSEGPGRGASFTIRLPHAHAAIGA